MIKIVQKKKTFEEENKMEKVKEEETSKEKERAATKENEQQDMEIQKLLEEDPLITYFTNMVKDNPYTKEWGTQKINGFLKYAYLKKIQNLCTTIIEDNYYLTINMDISEMEAIWNSFYSIIKDMNEGNMMEKLPFIEVILSVLNTLYKNISTSNEGMAINTYLNYKINKEVVNACIIAPINEKEEIKFKSKYLMMDYKEIEEIDLIENKIKINVASKDEERLMENKVQKFDVITLMIELSYHAFRNSNVFFRLFDHVKENEIYLNCLHIAKNKSVLIHIRGYLKRKILFYVFLIFLAFY